MPEQINISEFLELSKTLPVFDVRSPIEFNHGHIPDAINFPLFTDSERAAVGIRYKLSGSRDAMLLALELIGPKLAEKVKIANNLLSGNELLLHCWRGGMRSSSVAWLLETIGYKVSVLDGGYKSYRRFVRAGFEKKSEIIILAGMTGSGKTELLEQISVAGNQVINLEKIANHRGSVLGNIGLPEQPTNEQFENNLFAKWSRLDFSLPLWLEDESFQIGYVNIPEPLFEQMKAAKAIKIAYKSKAPRIKRLVNEYALFDVELIKQCIGRLEKRIGGKNIKSINDALDNKDFNMVADMLLEYYDRSYAYSQMKFNKIHDFIIEEESVAVNADKIIEFAKKI